MSTVSCAQTVCQPRVLDVPYVTRETWVICLPYVENYVDGYGKLPEQREDYGKTVNLPINL